MPVSKANIHVSNSTGVEISNSVRRRQSKDNKLKNRVSKNTNAKSSSAYVRKVSSSVRIDSNKRETKNSNECQSNASVLNTKNVTAINDGLNLVCVFCGKNVFVLSHEKCVARYDLCVDSREQSALGMITSQQSLDMEIMFKAISRYVTSHESNLYTISISEMTTSSPVCLMSRATSTKSWLWHRRLSHLNFGTVNQLTSKDLVDGLLKFKYNKYHVLSACEQEFKNEKLRSFYAKLGIVHHTSIAQTPQQNGVVERRNRTLVEAARTMLIFLKSPEFHWA
ncbi:retrovirus-related pol polyprotein from transposon TNT 1-94 [Tanacetum coccineum]